MTIIGAVQKALLDGGTTTEDVSGWNGLTDEVDAASESVEDGETGFEEPALSPFSGLLEPGNEPGESGEEEEEDEEEEGELEEPDDLVRCWTRRGYGSGSGDCGGSSYFGDRVGGRWDG